MTLTTTTTEELRTRARERCGAAGPQLEDAPSPSRRPPGRRSPARTCSRSAPRPRRGPRRPWRPRARRSTHGAPCPRPVRGALVKRWAELLTEHKGDVADLITIEVGKIRSEALGEARR